MFGLVIGLGVAMLPYFDYVFASTTTTFWLPNASLQLTSEGAFELAARCANLPKTVVNKEI